MKIDHLISDADGVLINSHEIACVNAHKIVSLFNEGKPFEHLFEIKKHFNRKAQIEIVGEKESDILRALHRLLMRHSSNQIHCFDEVVEIYKKLKPKKTIVTSAFASGIREILGENAKDFPNILGRESGRKSEILKGLVTGNEIYVTDSVRDIYICKEIGMPVIATGWGYDEAEHLNAQTPDFFVNNPNELNSLFYKLNLI